MFTKEMMEKIEAPFREQLKRMGTSGACGARAAQVERMVGEILSPGEAQALKCLYAGERCRGLSCGALRSFRQAWGLSLGEGAFCGQGPGEALRRVCAASSGEQ